MKRVTLLLLAALWFSPAFSAAQVFEDSVLLEDGAIVLGTVLEHRPGNYVIVEDARGLLRFLADRKVVSIVRRSEGETVSESHVVAFLDSGVIIRGALIQYRPDGTMTILTGSGAPVDVQAESVAKMLHVRTPIPPLQSDIADPAEAIVRTEAATLQIEIALGGGRANSGSDQTGKDRLGGLRDEIDDLENTLDGARRHAADGLEQDAAEGVAETTERVGDALAYLVDAAELCESSESTREKGNGQALSAGSAADILRDLRALETGLSDESVTDLSSRADQAIMSLASRAANPIEDPDGVRVAQARFAAFGRVNSLLAGPDARAADTRLQVTRAVADLAEADRRLLYDAHRQRDWISASAFNLIPLLPIGSIIQGDWLVPVVSWGGFLLVMLAAYEFYDLPPDEYFNVGDALVAMPPIGFNTWGFSVGVIAATYVYSLIAPVFYNQSQNEKLADSLSVDPRGLQW